MSIRQAGMSEQEKSRLVTEEKLYGPTANRGISDGGRETWLIMGHTQNLGSSVK